jgi:nitronate monooxygenase
MTTFFPTDFGFQNPLIIQAPMAGGITTAELVVAVSNANGLGSFATGYLTTEAVEDAILSIKKRTFRPYAVNVFIPPERIVYDSKKIQAYLSALHPYHQLLNLPEPQEVGKISDNFQEIIALLLDFKVPIVSITFGNLSAKIIQAFKQQGTYLMGTATTLEEAKILADSGIDALILQGKEAGGHQGKFLPSTKPPLSTFSLLSEVASHILDKPLIAAGGIMHGHHIKKAITLGARGVQMGTAFITTKESGASPLYKNTLIHTKEAKTDPTTLTKAFSGKYARGLNNGFMKAMSKKNDQIPDFPIAHYMSTQMRKEATKQGKLDCIAFWCGQGVREIREEIPAADLIDRLRQEMD